MNCHSCSVNNHKKPNEICGNMSRCDKLEVFDWLNNLQLPAGQQPCDIVEVRFKGGRKELYKNKDRLELKAGNIVAVESSPGHDIGIVSMTGEMVRWQMRKEKINENTEDIKNIYRIAKTADIEKWESVKALEYPTMLKAREIAIQLDLSMKINDVEYQGDKKKAVFYYTAEQRVDFRELIKKLAEEFGVRIEMKQIGMRQESGRIGGIADCGRELCCTQWLTDFKSVSTTTARYQNLSPNPSKLAGQCGKLKCCLNFEVDVYVDALKHFPDTSITLETKKGTAYHQKTDIFKNMMWYAFSKPQEEMSENVSPDTWVSLTVERVIEIIELNKKGEKPEDIKDVKLFEEENIPDFKDVVGQDSLTRMDKKNKKRPNKIKPKGKNKK